VTVYLGLGSNVGDRRAHLDDAIGKLKRVGTVERVSPYLENPAVLSAGDTVAQGPFLNGALAMQTPLEPHALLRALREIEVAAGRPAAREKWKARTLDLDILLWGEEVIETPELSVPHPQMHLRSFVLEPLALIAPDAVHPVLHKTVRELLADFAQKPAAPGHPGT
jgi:2-amino-4-hydroxy-6-hydroxymethyldihydropteridine diphosphokinase